MAIKKFVVLVLLLQCVWVAFAGREDFAWEGGDPGTELLVSGNAIGVKPGDILRFDIEWTKHEWNFGSAALLRIKWEDAKGGQLGVTAFNSKLTAIPGARNYPCVEEASLSRIGEPIKVKAYLKVPFSTAAKARVAFQCYGNASRFSLDSVSVSPVDAAKKPWLRYQPKRKQIEYGPQPYSDEDVALALKTRPRAVPRLVQRGDRVDLEIGSERIFPGIRHANRRDPMRGVREFEKAGFRIFNNNVYVGESTYNGESGFREPQLLEEDGSFNIALLESKVYEVLREDTNAYVMLVCKISATGKWKRENLAELECNCKGEFRIFDTWKFTDRYSKEYPATPGEGPVPSIFSRKFPADLSEPLAEAFRRFEKTDASKAVIGVYVTGGDDSQFRLQTDPWTSGVAKREFKNFLREKYGSDEKLARAWAMPGATIDGSVPPGGDEINPDSEFVSIGPSPASDFREFSSKAVARMNSAFRAAIKRGSPRLLAGGYSCAGVLDSSDSRGRCNLAMMMKDPNTDFIIWLPGYSRRRDEISVPLGLGAFNGSMVLNRKLMIAEMDVRYPYGKYLQSGIYKSDSWQDNHNDGTFRNFLDYFGAAAFAWGGAFHAYPLANNWYDYPEAMAAWRRVVDIANMAKARKYGPNRIAAVFDERSVDFASWKVFSDAWMRPPVRNLQVADAMWRVGVRFDQYEISDLMGEDFAAVAPKVILINDASTLSASDIASVRRRYCRDGRVILWVGNPGFHSGDGMGRISQAFGLGISTNGMDKPICAADAKDALCRSMKGFWNETSTGLVRRFAHSYQFECMNGWKRLANFAGTDVCAAAVRRAGGFTEIIVGSPGSVTPQFLRNACREAGFVPSLESDDFYIEGSGLIVVGGAVRSGVRRLRLPEGVEKVECLSGQTVREVSSREIEIDLECGKVAIFTVKNNDKE